MEFCLTCQPHIGKLRKLEQLKDFDIKFVHKRIQNNPQWLLMPGPLSYTDEHVSCGPHLLSMHMEKKH